ncbi:hypothetical protein YC2023_088937 [Brassica napus]
MVNSFTLLADLKAGGCSNTAECEPSAQIQTPFERRFGVHAKQFHVARSSNNFCLSNAPLSICFTKSTSFEKLTDDVKTIPTELF